MLVHEEMTANHIIFTNCHMKKRIAIVAHSNVVLNKLLYDLQKKTVRCTYLLDAIVK